MPECLTCAAPLGADSIALGFTDENGEEHAYCATHRKCATCNMSLSPNDLAFSYKLGLDKPRHPRCMTLTEKPSTDNADKLVKIVNWACTMTNTECLVKDMDFDAKYLFLNSIQSLAANLSILLRKDKAHFEQALRNKEQQERIDKRTPRPDPIKKAAALGIKTTSEKVARQKLTARDKAINALLAIGLTREQAEQSIGTRIQ